VDVGWWKGRYHAVVVILLTPFDHLPLVLRRSRTYIKSEDGSEFGEDSDKDDGEIDEGLWDVQVSEPAIRNNSQ